MRFDEVMGETWKLGPLIRRRDAHDIQSVEIVGAEGEALAISHETYAMQRYIDAANERLPMRAAVAVLGKRALSLVLALDPWDEDNDMGACSRFCRFCHVRRGPTWVAEPEPSHTPTCEWGSIVAEAKRLRGEL